MSNPIPLQRPDWIDKIHGTASSSQVTDKDVSAAQAEMDADPNLAKNGWTVQELAKYHKSRGGIEFRPSTRKRRPTRTNGKHNPHKWRRS